MSHNCILAHSIAKETGQPTYQGKPCRFGHSGKRYTADRFCVQCRLEGRSAAKRDSRPEHPEGPLAKAQGAWIDIQRQHAPRPAHKLWGLFLDSIRDDPEVYEAAMANMDFPRPPRPKEQRGFQDALTEWARRHGVFELEAKMRTALHAGRTAEASRMRADAMDLMRKGAAQVSRMLAGCSS
jgi:hypothetical protein